MNKTFHQLWSAQTLYGLGAQLTTLAIPVFAVRHLDAPPFEVGIIIAAAYLPYLLFSLHIGVLVDRVPKGRLITGVDAIRVVALLFLLGVAQHGQASLPILLTFVVAASSCTAARDVGLSAMVGVLVGRDELPKANARLAQSKSIAEIVGPISAGAMLVTFDFRLVILAELLLMTGALLVSATTARKISVNQVPSATDGRSAISAIKDGIRFLSATRTLRELLYRQVAWNFFIFMVVALLVPLFANQLHFSDREIGIVMAAMSAGTLLGSTIIYRRSLRLSGLEPLSLATYVGALSYLLLPATAHVGILAFTMAVVLRLLVGLSVSVFYVAAQSARQAEAPPEMQGRIVATVRFVSFGVIPLGSLVGGAVGNILGAGPAIVLASIGLLATNLILDLARVRRPSINPLNH